MAKVVGRDEKAVKRATCKNCASIIEYTPGEVYEGYARDYGGGGDTFYRLTCPSCGTVMYNVSKR